MILAMGSPVLVYPFNAESSNPKDLGFHVRLGVEGERLY